MQIHAKLFTGLALLIDRKILAGVRQSANWWSLVGQRNSAERGQWHWALDRLAGATPTCSGAAAMTWSRARRACRSS